MRLPRAQSCSNQPKPPQQHPRRGCSSSNWRVDGLRSGKWIDDAWLEWSISNTDALELRASTCNHHSSVSWGRKLHSAGAYASSSVMRARRCTSSEEVAVTGSGVS